MMWLWLWGIGLHAEEPIDQAMTLINAHFPTQFESSQLQHAALQGITEHLNQQQASTENKVLTAEAHAAQQAHQRGQRTGIGALYQLVSGQGLLLNHVFPSGPAATAGLQRGDVIVAINDHPFTGQTADDIFNTVHLETQRPTITLDVRREHRHHRFELQRDVYNIPSAFVHPEESDCIVLLFFGDGAAQTLKTLMAQRDPTRGLLIDMRDNQGGQLSEAIAAASLFLDPGTRITTLHDSDGAENIFVAEGGRRWTAPLILLINERTAGVAEAFVSALHDHNVAQLSGTQTAGQAHLPQHYPLEMGLVLQLGNAMLRSPSGQNWNATGITPDLWIESVSDSPSGILPDVQLRVASGLLRDP